MRLNTSVRTMIQSIHASMPEVGESIEKNYIISSYHPKDIHQEQILFWGDLTDTVHYPILNINHEQLLLKARRALVPEILERWKKAYRDYSNFCDLVISSVTKNLLETFLDIAMKEEDQTQPYRRSYLRLYYDPAKQRNIAALSPDLVHKVQSTVQRQISDTMDRERIWDDMVEWNWEYSIPWALNIMVNRVRLDYNLEKEDSRWSHDLNYIICRGNAKNSTGSQVRAYQQGVIHAFNQRFDLSHKSISEIEAFLGIENSTRNTGRLLKYLPEESGYLTTSTSALYQQLRTEIGAGGFGVSLDQPWLTASLNNFKGTVKGLAQIRLSAIDSINNEEELKACLMRQQEIAAAMDDETADVLDIIFHIWLQSVRHPEEMIIITADDFLRMRGLMEQKGGNGRRGGYKQEWRGRIARHMEILKYIWIDAEHQTLKGINSNGCSLQKMGRELVTGNLLEFNAHAISAVKENSDQYIWCVRPGDMFAQTLMGPGRQTGLLPQQALRFDPYRQNLEKRAARYFSWQWRNRQKELNYLKAIRVRTIMEGIRMDFNYSRPAKTIERFEKMLDTLHEHGLIQGWQYLGSYSKWQKWLELSVIVEPPQKIVDHYLRIRSYGKKTLQMDGMKRKNDNGFNAQELKRVRLARNLTQMQVAEQLGIDQTTLSRIENGRAIPGFKLLDQINKWMV